MIAFLQAKVKLKITQQGYKNGAEAEKQLDKRERSCQIFSRTNNQINMLERGIMGLGMVILLIIFFLLHRKINSTKTPDISLGAVEKQASKKWMLIISLTIIVFYVLITHIISLAWLKGDDYIFIAVNDMSLTERLQFIFARYINCNSRPGDITCSLLGIAENRWQQILLTPIFIILAPFVLFRLLKRTGESIYSFKGWLVIILTVPMMLLSAQIGGNCPWRVFWCFAASVNYLWPCVIISLFLTFYRFDSVFSKKAIVLKCFGMFLIGLYSGWALECVSIFLIPGLLIWYVLNIQKKRHVQPAQFSGIIGCLSGAFMLFGSPALGRRGASELANRVFNPENMSFGECFQFVTNHSPENMALLKGGTVQYILDGIPIVLHPFYLPELLENIWDCSNIVICIIAIFSLYAAITKQFKALKRGLISSLLGILCACSYLYSCIPSAMSFWPTSFILLATAIYFFMQLKLPIGVRTMLGFTVLGTAVYNTAPSVIEAQQYKAYEQIRLNNIQTLVNNGEKYVSLPPPYPTTPQDKLGLIRCMDLESDAKTYPNFIAKDHYKLEAISQKR